MRMRTRDPSLPLKSLLIIFLACLMVTSEAQVGPHQRGLPHQHGQPHQRGLPPQRGLPQHGVPPPRPGFVPRRRVLFRPLVLPRHRVIYGRPHGARVPPRAPHRRPDQLRDFVTTERPFERSETRREISFSTIQPVNKLVMEWESQRIEGRKSDTEDNNDDNNEYEDDNDDNNEGNRRMQNNLYSENESFGDETKSKEGEDYFQTNNEDKYRGKEESDYKDENEYYEENQYYDENGEDNEEKIKNEIEEKSGKEENGKGEYRANLDNHQRPRVTLPNLQWSALPTLSTQREQTRALSPFVPTTERIATKNNLKDTETIKNATRVIVKKKKVATVDRLQDFPADLSQLSKSIIAPGRIPVLVKRLAKVPKNKSTICDNKDLIECEPSPISKDFSNDKETNMGSMVPFVRLLRHEVWVMPILFLSILVFLLLFFFELYLVSQVFGHAHQNPKNASTLVVSKRHLFLGQTLILGLFSCCITSALIVLNPTETTCALIRLGTGLSYALIYASLLVKLVYLLSIKKGVFLPTFYQLLLLCFAILIQIVVGVQWVSVTPPSLRTLNSALNENDIIIKVSRENHNSGVSCKVSFEDHIQALLYIFFLIVTDLILAFRARRVRDNYRESTYIGLALFFSICIFLLWMSAGLLVPETHADACLASGLVANAAILFVVMYLPKGRQLTALGREGIYAEDARIQQPLRFEGFDSSDEERGVSIESTVGQTASFMPIKQEAVHKHRRNRQQGRAGRGRSWERLSPSNSPPVRHHQSMSNLVFERNEDEEDLNWHLRRNHPEDRRNLRMPGFLHTSLHDLHAANAQRASRSDLREMRDELRRRQLSHDELRQRQQRRASPRARRSEQRQQECPRCAREWPS